MTPPDGGKDDGPATSLHQRILQEIEARILSAEWPPGYKIPFEHELTAQYGCSRMTVNKVLTQLVNAGLIERRRRAGSFVTRPVSQSAVLTIQDIQAEVLAQGLPYRFEITSRRRRRSGPADAPHLDLATPVSILDLTCVHYAGGRPFCLEERVIDLVTVPEAKDEPFSDIPPGTWLVTRVPWTVAEHTIRAIPATTPVATALKLAPETACLVVERKTWRGERAVTYVRLTYPGDAHQLVARFTPTQG